MDSTEMSSLGNTVGGDTSTEDDPCIPGQGKSYIVKSGEVANNGRGEPVGGGLEVKGDKGAGVPPLGWRLKLCSPPTTRFEKWCSERTGLHRTGLLGVALLLLLIVALLIAVLVMTLLWPTLPHPTLFPICRTAGCLTASSEIVSKMNHSADPCHDFRHYACGGWLSSHHIPNDKSVWGTKQHLQLKHREKLRDMINTMLYSSNPTSLEWKVKTFYDSCVSTSTIETEGDIPLKKIITQLGGWHVLRSLSLPSFDRLKTMKYLHSRYKVEPFFKVEVVPDVKHPDDSIIKISPSNLGLPDKSYYYRSGNDEVVKAYKMFLKDVPLSLDASTTLAGRFSDDMFGFERRLAERFPSQSPPIEQEAYYRPTIAKLEEIAPSVPLFDILTSMFPKAKLSKETEVLVTTSDYLVNLSEIMSSTDNRVFNNYFLLKFVLKYIPFLSEKYRTTVDEFHKHLYGIKEPTPRWEMCIKTLQEYMGYGLEVLYENSMKDTERKRRVVEEMFENIRKALRESIKTSNNLPSHVQEHFMDKIDTVGVQIGLPAPMKLNSSSSNYYEPLAIIKDDFFLNILGGVSFILEESKRRLNNPSEEHRWMDIATDGKLSISYVPEINKVIIPLSALSMPYFNVHYPLSVLYGGLGQEIGLAVVKSITGRGVLHSGDGALLSNDHPLHNRTGANECILHHPHTTSLFQALTHTFKALQTITSQLPHVHQPALEYLEDDAIFFITYAQSLCSMRTPQRRDMDETLKARLDDVEWLYMLGERSKEFKKTFMCSKSLRKELCDDLI